MSHEANAECMDCNRGTCHERILAADKGLKEIDRQIGIVEQQLSDPDSIRRIKDALGLAIEKFYYDPDTGLRYLEAHERNAVVASSSDGQAPKGKESSE